MSRKNTATIPVALFDISSSSVGGAHALVKKGPQATIETISILAQSRVDATLQEDLNIERFVSETLKGIESVATTIRGVDAHLPEYIQVVLASPWYSSQTRTILYNKTTPFLCTEKMVSGLIDKEIEHIIANEKDRFGDLGREYSIVEKQVSLIKLNGYVTHAPYGKRATSLELYLTVTVAPKRIIDQFTDLIRRIYGTRKIGVTTSAYTTFVATRQYAEHAEPNAVIVDVGEEITDVAFIKDELFLYQHSFPTGTYELYRSVAASTGSSFAEVKGMLEAYRLHKLSKTTTAAIDKAFASFVVTWQKGLQGVVDQGHYGFVLPKQWYCVVDAKFEQVLKKAIMSDAYVIHQSTNAPQVTMVTPELLSSVKGLYEVPVDVPVALGLLFIDRLV